MARYIGKRLLQMIPVLIIISIGIFAIVELMPGDPIAQYIGEDGRYTAEELDRIRENLGLNGSPVERYFRWVGRMLTGDFGNSTSRRQPVNKVIGTFIWNSFILNIVVLVISFTISIFVGIHSAVKKGGFFDKIFTVFSLIFVSIPTFVFGLILIFIFAVNLKWLPMNGMVIAGHKHANTLERMGDIAFHMILPATVLILAKLASQIRYIRSSVLDVIDQDYIRTARAKGLSESVVVYKHAFRNALIPIVTLLGAEIATMFSGAVMLETIFLWPGMGKVMVDCISTRDMPLMLVLFLFFAVTTLIGNLIADIGYALVDPRVKLGS